MKHCITIPSLVNELFKNTNVHSILLDPNGLIDKFINDVKSDGTLRYSHLFKRSNETIEDYNTAITENGNSLFKYRASLFIINWYNSRYGDYVANTTIDRLYTELTLPIVPKVITGSTQGEKLPVSITSFYSSAITKLVVDNISNISESVKDNNSTYRAEIIDLVKRKSREYSKNQVNITKEVITDQVIDDLNSSDSVIYPKVLDLLAKVYNINIKNIKVLNAIDISRIEDAVSNEDNIPLTWNISDDFTTDVVSRNMTSEFKIKLARILSMTNGSISDISYLPTYLNINQISNMLSILHSNDNHLGDFKFRIEHVAKYDPAFKSLFNMFKTAEASIGDSIPTDEIKSVREFVQQYMHVFNTAHTLDVELVHDAKFKILSKDSNKENYAFFRIMDKLNDVHFLRKLVSLGSITSIENKIDLVTSLGFGTYASAIIDSSTSDLEPFQGANDFYTGIIKYANAKLKSIDNLSSKSIALDFPLSSFIKRATSFPMWYVNLQYIDANGNKVFVPTKPSFLTNFTKGLTRGTIVTESYRSDGSINEKRVNHVFADILSDPTLRNSPFLHDTDESSMGMFYKNDNGSYSVSNPRRFSMMFNPMRISAFNKNDVSIPYNKIFGLTSFDFLKTQLDSEIYVIHNSDANSTYGIQYYNLNAEDCVKGYKQMVLVDRDVFTNGLDVIAKGGIENPIRYGVDSNNRLIGEVFKFKETAYIKNNKVYNYLLFLESQFTEMQEIGAVEFLRDLYINSKSDFDRYFADDVLQAYVGEYVEYQLNDSTSEFNKLTNAVRTKNSPSYGDIRLSDYMSHQLVGHTVNAVFNGIQSEYKNDIDFNKRGSQIGKKSSVIDESIKKAYRVLVFNDIVIDSPVADKLTAQVPHLAKVFTRQNSTDGISFVTDVTLERILRATGKWDQYKKVVFDLRAGKLINPSMYNRVVEQLKMFGYARRPQNTIFKASNDPSLASYQFKDSTVVLFRSSVEGTEFEKVYDCLVDNKIDQLSSESAVKVGFTNKVKLHNSKGDLSTTHIDSILESKTLDNHILNMRLSDFGPQQENISHVVDEDSTLASQAIKKLTSDLNLDDAVYKFNNKFITGRELDTIVQDSLSTTIENQTEKLMYRLGVYGTDGTIQYLNDQGQIQIDFIKFKDMLRELADSQDISDNIKSVLNLDIPQTASLFSLPTVYNAFKYLVIAQYNEVLKLKLPGTHVTIVPDVFRNTITSTSDIPLRGVTYSSAFLKDIEVNRNGSYKLREEYGYNEKGIDHVLGEKESNEDTFHYAEIVINPYHFDIFSEYTEIRKVERTFTRDGKKVTELVNERYIDIDAIDPSVLELIALRIPTDSKASIIISKVVGFLNDGSSKAVVPVGLINRTGWDFDNDTIYTYHKHVKLVDDTLTAITKDNAYNDLVGGKFEAYMDRVNSNWRTDILDKHISSSDIMTIAIYIANNLPVYIPSSEIDINTDNEFKSTNFEQLDRLLDDVISYIKDNKLNTAIISTIERKFQSIASKIKTIKVQGSDIIDFINDYVKVGASTAEYDKVNLRTKATIAINNVYAFNKSIEELKSILNYKNVSKTIITKLDLLLNPNVQHSKGISNVVDIINNIYAKYNADINSFLESDNQYKKTFDSYEGSLRQESQAVVDNQLIDAYTSILKSKEHINERNRSNESTKVVSASERIKKDLNFTKFVNFNSPYVKAYYQGSNMSIGNLKSLSVACDGGIAILQRINAYYKNEGFVRYIDAASFPRNSDGSIIDLTPAILNKYYRSGDYEYDYDVNEQGVSVVKGVTIRSRYIGNNSFNTKLSIDGTSINDAMAEFTPAIFDAVKHDLAPNINDKTLMLLKLLASTPVTEWDGKLNNPFLYGMALVHIPIVVEFTNRAIRNNTSLYRVISDYSRSLKNGLPKSIPYSANQLIEIFKELIAIENRRSNFNSEIDSLNAILKAEDTSIELFNKTTIDIASRTDLNYKERDRRDIINNQILSTLFDALVLCEDFNSTSKILRTEKRMQGDFSAYNFNNNVIRSMVNFNKLTPYKMRGLLSNIQFNDEILVQARPMLGKKDPNLKEYKVILSHIISHTKSNVKQLYDPKDIIEFAKRNPNIFEAISSNIRVDTKHGNSILPAAAIYPTLLGLNRESVNSYLQSNINNAHYNYKKSYSDIFIQHSDEMSRILTDISYMIPIHNDRVYSNIVDSVINFITQVNFNPTDSENSYIKYVLSKFETDVIVNDLSKSDIEVAYRRLLTDNINKKKGSKYINLYNKVSTNLIGYSTKLKTAGHSLLDIDIDSNPKLKELYNDFISLTPTDKLKLIRIAFSDYIDVSNVFHMFNTSIVTTKNSTKLRYTQHDTLVLDQHAASFEESLKHSNLFISNTTKDIMLSAIILNGFQFGYNVGRLIPISYFTETYANDNGHPIESLHSLGRNELTLEEGLSDKFLYYYIRQNIQSAESISPIKFRALVKSDNPLVIDDGINDKLQHTGINIQFVKKSNVPTYVDTHKYIVTSKSVAYGITMPARLYGRYSIIELFNISGVMIDANINLSKYDDYYAILPIGALLKSEFGEVSVIDSNNISFKDVSYGVSDLATLLFSQSLVHNNSAHDVLELLDSLIEDDLNILNLEEVEEIDQSDVSEESEYNTTEIEMGVVDLTQEPIDDNDTVDDIPNESNDDNILAIKSQIAKTVNVISKSRSIFHFQQIEHTDFDDSINRIGNIISKDSFSYDDPKRLADLIGEMLKYHKVAYARLGIIVDRLNELDRDVNLYKNESTDENPNGSSNYIEYTRLLSEGANIIAVLDSIQGLNIEGINKLSRGFIEQMINDKSYIIVTKDNIFNTHSANTDIINNPNVIRSFDEFKKVYNESEINKLQAVIDDGYFSDPTVRYKYQFNPEGSYEPVNILLTEQTTRILINSFKVGFENLTLDEQNTPIIVNGFVTGNVNTIHNFLNRKIDSIYNYALNSTNKYDTVIDGIANITVQMSSIRPLISIVERHRRELYPKTIAMQSRNGGLLYTKIIDNLIANGIEASEENIEIHRNEFIEFITTYMNNERDVDAVNMGIKYFGTPSNTTDSRVDIMLAQFTMLRTRNRLEANKFEKSYKDLLVKYNINSKNEDLFYNGNLLTEYKYDEIGSVRYGLYGMRSTALNAKLEASNKREAHALFNKNISIAIDHFDTLYSINPSVKKQLNLLRSRLVKTNINDDTVSLFDTYSDAGLFKIFQENGIEVFNADRYKSEMNKGSFDANQYVEFTSFVKGYNPTNSDHKIYIKFKYADSFKNLKYAELVKSNSPVINFIKDYNDLINNVFKLTSPTGYRQIGSLPFISKSSVLSQVKSYVGWRSIGTTNTYVDLEDNVHYRSDFNGIFKSTWFTPFHNPFMDIELDDHTNDELKIQAFTKFYKALKKQHRLEIPDGEITVDTIDDYNAKVYSANEMYKNTNQTYDLDILTNKFISDAEFNKTSFEFDNVITASNIRQSIVGANTKGMIEHRLRNLHDSSRVKSKADQFAGLLLRGTSVSFMAFNYLSGIKNVLSGTLHVIEESVGNGIVNGNDIRNAMGLFIKDVIPNAHHLRDNPTNNRTVFFMQLFDDIYEDTRDTVTGGGLSKTMGWIDTIMYSPNTMGEVFMQFSMLLANTKSHRVVPGDKTGGKIMAFNEYSNYIQEAEFKSILTPAQLKLYNFYRKSVEIKNKNSRKHVSNVDTIFYDFIKTLVGANENGLSKDQISRINDVKKTLKVKQKEFNKFPTLEESINVVDGEIVFSKNSNGKPAFTREELGKFVQRVAVINQNLHGIYNKLDKSAIQSKAIGEILTQFRKWMYPTYGRYAGKHFMKNSFNEQSGLVETPIMKPIYDLLKTMFSIKDHNNVNSNIANADVPHAIKNVGINLFRTIGNIRLYYRMLPTYEKAAMDRSIKTIAVIVGTSIAANIAYGALKDRDEKEKNKLLATASYLLDGVFNEWSILIPVYGQYTEYRQFKRKLFISEDVLVNLHKAIFYGMILPATMDSDDPDRKNLYYSRGSNKGKSRAMVAFKKTIPVWRQIEKQMNIEDYSKFFEMNNMFMQMR